jgi:hypothetical protein
MSLRDVIRSFKDNDSAMKHSWFKPRLQKWQHADHKFAIGAVALMIFLSVAGLTNWFLNGNQGVAAAGGSSTAVTTIR